MALVYSAVGSMENAGISETTVVDIENPTSNQDLDEVGGVVVRGTNSSRSRGSSSSSKADLNVRDRQNTYTPAAPDNSPTVLSFTGISVTTRTAPEKVLLNNLSGSITGGFWAIMGASGGGKTTLLSTLSLRIDPKYMKVEGDIRLNGRQYSRNVLKAMSAYVMQDDLLHAELTVQETLFYAAKLRMARGTTAEERTARIDYLLSLLGISHVQDVIIGNTRRKGVSGGERKRVSIAMELLNKPKLLFLDEPTSGLDSSTALAVCEAMKNLALKGECTVVCTIHQPQPKIFLLFDNIILMKRGQIVYQGAAKKSELFLDDLGMPCPPNVALADHLLDVISPAHEFGDFIDDTAQQHIVPVNLSLGLEKDFDDKDSKHSWLEQFTILFQRTMQQYLRNTDIIFMNLVLTIFLAVFIGRGLWYQIGTGQASLQTRVPSLFFACVTQGIVGSLQAINSFPAERAIMLRERQAGTYQVSSYFMAKTVVDILTQLWPPMLFTCIVYFLIGYQPNASKFFYYMLFMVLDQMAATSIATTVTCFCVSVELSTVVLAFVFEVCRLFGGFFASPAQIKLFPKWRFADALSFIKYAFVGVTITQLQGLELSCPAGQHCAIINGSQIMAANGYDEYTTSFCIAILIVLIVGARLLAYLALRFIKV